MMGSVAAVDVQGVGSDATTVWIHPRGKFWGFKAFYEPDGTLVLRVRAAPVIDSLDPLRGIRITVDPGHPPAGAVGPTGLVEADANLAIALRLAALLRLRGAEVILTRTDGADVSLVDRVDLAVNSIALIVQLTLTARLTARLGTGWMLALMPLASLAGFAALGAAPTLAVLLVVGVIRRAGEFAISKPVREALYTVVPREERYKAKGFIDTVVYRGGDAASGWLFGLLRGAGLGLSGLAWAALPVAGAWLAVSFWLGRRQAQSQANAPRA